MTSVKEFRIETEPTADSLGRGSFTFTDDYSVFDWGKMPDEIPEKGASLCTMGASNFELLETNHVPTHYEGVVEGGEREARRASEGANEQGSRDIVDLGDAIEPPREMAIALTQVPELPYRGGAYDYDQFHAEAGANYLIPLEVVFRNHVPVGSSLRRRTDPADHGLDFESWPEEAVELDSPIVEFSTKYEEQDRYLDREAADAIAGRAEIERLEELALAVNHVVTEQAADAGLTHEDGKIECLYFQGEIRVADVVGTFDENRFAYDGQQVSKEVVRQYYKRTDPDWVEAVAAAKAEARRREVADWRTLCEDEPNILPEHVIQTARNLYTAGANAYTGVEWFDAPDLADAVEAVREL